MKTPTKRASWALGAGGAGAITTTLEQVVNGVLFGGTETGIWHTCAFLAFGVLTYLLEATRDAIKASSGGAVDLTATVDEFKRVTADGVLDAADSKALAKAAAKDVDGVLGALLDSQGADRVYAAIERAQGAHPEADDPAGEDDDA